MPRERDAPSERNASPSLTPFDARSNARTDGCAHQRDKGTRAHTRDVCAPPNGGVGGRAGGGSKPFVGDDVDVRWCLDDTAGGARRRRDDAGGVAGDRGVSEIGILSYGGVFDVFGGHGVVVKYEEG